MSGETGDTPPPIDFYNDTKPHPEVQMWPECPTCQTAYVLRKCFVFGGGPTVQWLWQRDCKHKAKAILVMAERAAETGGTTIRE